MSSDMIHVALQRMTAGVAGACFLSSLPHRFDQLPMCSVPDAVSHALASVFLERWAIAWSGIGMTMREKDE
jgi:hypothetical protein